MRTVCGTILAAAVAVTCAVGMADGGDSVSGRGTTPATTFAAQYLVKRVGTDPAERAFYRAFRDFNPLNDLGIG